MIKKITQSLINLFGFKIVKLKIKKYEINCVKLTGRWNEYDDFIDLNYNFNKKY